MPIRRLLAILSVLCPALLAQVNPVPQISQPLSPSAATPGTSSVSLFVNGAGFVASSTIQWNGSVRTTTFLSAIQLSTTLSASDLAVAETASVTVLSPAPGGGASNVAFFEVRQPISPPAFVDTNLNTGLGPRFAAAADFNGDGRLDLAIVNKTANTLSILLGVGGGIFASHMDNAVGTTPNSVAVGDFNDDGKADLAVTNYASANLSVLIGNGDGTFQNQVNYVTGPNPESAVIGDFNRDGHLDIVTANKGSTTLSVLLGNGDGTFQGKVDYQAGMGPFSVTVGDFNRDGILDLACANQSGNSVSVLLGNGDGSFQTHTDFTVGMLPQGIATADLNGDGILDLVTANTTSSTVSILLGNGNGTFQTHVDYAAGGASSVTIADFNGDGIQDLAVAGGLFVEYLQGNGNGTFQPYIFLETIATPMNVAAGDFDGDGRLDMAAPTLNSNSVAVMVQSFAKLSTASLVFPNQAVGTTSTPQNVTLTNTSPYTLSISTITITGNDSTEFAQTNNCGSSLAAGNACTLDVIFSPITVGSLTATLSITDSGGFSPQLISLSGTGVAIASPLINDPLVPHVASPGGTGFTLTVNGSGFFPGATVYWNGSARTTTFVSGSQVTAAITAADIAKVGVALITSANPGSDLSNAAYFDITQPTTSITLKSSSATVGLGPRWAASADFNLDGKTDLAIANSSANTVSLLLGNGDGTFKSHVDYATGSGPGFVTTGDFNGDGNVDLATANGNASTISILLGKGDGTFQTHVDYAAYSGPSSLQVGDFNQDGILDIAVVSTGSGKIRLFLGDGDGTFKGGATYVTSPTLNHLAAGDLNGDGKLDLVATNYNESELYVFIGNGDGTFTETLIDTTGTNPKSVALADVNGDGKLDAIVANYGGNSVSVLLGNGDGTFQTHVDYTTGSAPRDVEVGDLNGDGFLDIAVPDYNANKASTLLGNGNGTFQAHLDFTTGGSPSSISIADYNGDGRLDLVTPNYTSNTVSVLLQAPAVSLSPTSLAFGNQIVGTKSQPKVVTVTNNGSASFVLQSIQFSGTNKTDFAETNTCSGSISPGASCTVSVTFTPGAKGSRSATMNIYDNAANSPQKVTLSGTGT